MSITYSNESLVDGVNALADAVKITMGPGGYNVILANREVPIITKDGVSVAKEITLENPFENLGAHLLKEAAIQTNDKVGDGTTTATVLAQAIIKEGLKSMDTKEYIRDLKDTLPTIIKRIKKQSREIESRDDIYNVALVSLDGDAELASILADLYDRVADNITYAESKTGHTYKEVWEGMRLRSSYLSTYFITDKDLATVDYNEGFIVVLDGKINKVKQILPYMDHASHNNRPLVIVAEDVDNNTIINIMNNVKKGNLECTVIKSPGLGFGRAKQLEDLAAYTSTEVYNVDTNRADKIMGTFKSIHIDETHSVIRIEEKTKEIKEYVKGLEALSKRKDTEDKKFIQTRIDRFKEGVGCLFLDANSFIELKERKDRVEDAVNAVKAAIKGGVVPGAGTSLVNVGGLYSTVLSAPINQIKYNMHLGESDMLTVDDYILDPTLVVTTALESAVSVASTILSTKAAVL